ncbi:gustatory receptor for sugar taste 43a-like [Nilaparvata lugens]|uniref:gustatory receptor for sugar taste 43a-like n=1 Tax=Nilaparvata lugens TaxID=108931 RepID=UPI00193E80A4|nr:gustatory receptor for sugar taste 43a-like [Nilaparvata lugens]
MLNQPVFIFVFVCSGLLSFFILVVQLLVLISPCVETTDEANKTLKIICMINMENIPLAIRERLEAFTLINRRSVEFCACGLFELNPTLITSLAGTVATYLVILIQIKPDEEY